MPVTWQYPARLYLPYIKSLETSSQDVDHETSYESPNGSLFYTKLGLFDRVSLMVMGGEIISAVLSSNTPQSFPQNKELSGHTNYRNASTSLCRAERSFWY